MTKKYPFDSDGYYTYGFTSSGLFTLINKGGESLYDKAIPLLEKLGSHFLWIFLWIVVLVASNLIFSDPKLINRLFMSLIFFHLFLVGCRVTSLMLNGKLKPLFFPPLWIRLTRELQKGGGIEILKKHTLDTHPGLLVNLALTQFTQGHAQEGQATLKHALSFCPDHPDILQICAQLLTKTPQPD